MDLFNTKIFNFISHELGDYEIVHVNCCIWVINKKTKEWYLELKCDGHLWWRYGIFSEIFSFLSMSFEDYEPLISQWVEFILNVKVTCSSFQISEISQQSYVKFSEPRVTIPIWEHNELFNIT